MSNRMLLQYSMHEVMKTWVWFSAAGKERGVKAGNVFEVAESCFCGRFNVLVEGE